ncbi:Mitochondrial distribution and morphology protein 31, mitochondrial precursor, partial [Clydaea vesicula]
MQSLLRLKFKTNLNTLSTFQKYSYLHSEHNLKLLRYYSKTHINSYNSTKIKIKNKKIKDSIHTSSKKGNILINNNYVISNKKNLKFNSLKIKLKYKEYTSKNKSQGTNLYEEAGTKNSNNASEPKNSIWRKILIFLKLDRSLYIDDFVAFFSWFFVGSEYLAKKIGEYLTDATGFQVNFESAIMPNWREGTIKLNNVSIVCNRETWKEWCQQDRKSKGLTPLKDDEIDSNFTYYDLEIKEVDVTLSLYRFHEGKGLIKECKLDGVRGQIDRRHVSWNNDWVAKRRVENHGDFEIENFRVEDFLVSVLSPGDFRPFTVSIFQASLPQFRRQWMLFDILSASNVVGMFENSLFSIHKPQREEDFPEWENDTEGKWAKMVYHINYGTDGPFGWIKKGKLDIDLHLIIPQTSDKNIFNLIETELKNSKNLALNKIEEVIVEHESRNKEFGILEPSGITEFVSSKILNKSTEGNGGISNFLELNDLKNTKENVEFYRVLHPMQGFEKNNKDVKLDNGKNDKEVELDDDKTDSDINLKVEKDSEKIEKDLATPQEKAKKPLTVLMYWKVRLNDLKSSIPVINQDLSYISNAMIRPVVAFLNANKNSTDLEFNVEMDLENFNGGQTIYDTGIA